MMQYFKNKNITVFFFYLLLFSALIIPSGNSYYLDGLPWTNKVETITICFFSIFIIFFWQNLKQNKIVKILILISFFLKLLLSTAPQNGIAYKQYFNDEEISSDNFTKTYDTFWYKNYSGIQKFAWTKKENFPIDWDIASTHNHYNEKKYFNSKFEYNDLLINYKIKFYLLANKKLKFKLKTNGSKNNSNVFFSNIKSNNKNLKNFKINEFNEVNPGIYEFYGTLSFEGKNISIEPEIFIENYLDFPFSLIFFEKPNYNIDSIFFSVINYLGLIFNFIILTIFALIFFSNFNKKFCIFFISTLFFIIMLSLNKIIQIFYTDQFGSLGFLTAFIILNLLFIFKFLSYSNFSLRDLIIIIAPSFIYIFINKFFYNLESYYFLQAGNDWTQFEIYSRMIVVDNEWLVAGEDVFYFRPAPRYYYAILHILFGKSFFIIRVLDAWFVIGIVIFVIKILQKLNINKATSLLSGSTLLIFYIGDNFRWTIGRGLCEWFACFLIFFSIYLIINEKNNSIKFKKFITLSFVTIVGIIGSWLREEHIFVILCLILFYNQSDNKNIFISDFINQFKKNYLIIFLYSFFVIFGFLIMFLRNYYLGGRLGLSHPAVTVDRDFFEVISVLFAGTEKGQIPRLYTPILILSFLLSLFSIFSKKIYQLTKNFAVIACLLFTVLPFIILDNKGYVPRHAIYFIPFAIIIITMFISSMFQLKLKKVYDKKK